MAGRHSVHSHATEGGRESSSESELSHNEEDAPGEDENAKADKGEAETSSDGQVASDGEDTLTSVSQVFGTQEDTNPKCNLGEEIQSIR